MELKILQVERTEKFLFEVGTQTCDILRVAKEVNKNSSNLLGHMGVLMFSYPIGLFGLGLYAIFAYIVNSRFKLLKNKWLIVDFVSPKAWFSAQNAP